MHNSGRVASRIIGVAGVSFPRLSQGSPMAEVAAGRLDQFCSQSSSRFGLRRRLFAVRSLQVQQRTSVTAKLTKSTKAHPVAPAPPSGAPGVLASAFGFGAWSLGLRQCPSITTVSAWGQNRRSFRQLFQETSQAPAAQGLAAVDFHHFFRVASGDTGSRPERPCHGRPQAPRREAVCCGTGSRGDKFQPVTSHGQELAPAVGGPCHEKPSVRRCSVARACSP